MIGSRLLGFSLAHVGINCENEAVPLCRALVAGGLPAAEVTLRTACAEDCIKIINKEVPGMLLGAGTVLTMALGPNVVDVCREACKADKAKGIKISCDLNYRGKLWTRAQAREAMTDLCQYVDVCISNEEDAKDVFGIEAEATDITAGSLNHEQG